MTEEQSAPRNRDERGRLLPGHSIPGPGRPSKKSLTEALRDLVDPDEAARMLWRRARKSDTVLMYVHDRLEGRPKQALDVGRSEDDPGVQAMKQLAESLKEKRGNPGA